MSTINSPYDAIIVFGSGAKILSYSKDEIEQMSPEEISDLCSSPARIFEGRLLTALHLYQNGAAPKIIVSGADRTHHNVPSLPEGEIGRIFLINNGVRSEDIICENNAKFTYDNVAESLNTLDRISAIRADQGLPQENFKKFIAVSNESHLPRVRKAMEIFDLDFVAMPTEATLTDDVNRYRNPAKDYSDNLDKLDLQQRAPGTWVPLALLVKSPDRLEALFAKYPNEIANWFERHKEGIYQSDLNKTTEDLLQDLIEQRIAPEVLRKEAEWQDIAVREEPREEIANFEPTLPRDYEPPANPRN